MKIVSKYIIKNFLSNFFLYLVVVSILLLLNYIYQLIHSLLVHKTPLLESAKLFFYLIPSVFVITVPVSFLLSVMVTISTMNENRELLVISTLGINHSLYTSKLFMLAIIFTAILMYLNTDITPKSYKNFRTTYSKLVTSKPYINFFNGATINIQNKKICVHKAHNVGNKTLLETIMIFSPSEEHNAIQTIFAKRAYVYTDIYNNLIFDLYDGNCLTLSKLYLDSCSFLKFESYRFIIFNEYISKLISRSYSIRELTSSELLSQFTKESSQRYRNRLISEFTLRYCLSFSVLSFMVIGTILGLKIKYGAKPLSFVFTVLIILIYYFLFTASTAMIENLSTTSNLILIHFIAQIPNIFLLILSLIVAVVSK